MAAQSTPTPPRKAGHLSPDRGGRGRPAASLAPFLSPEQGERWLPRILSLSKGRGRRSGGALPRRHMRLPCGKGSQMTPCIGSRTTPQALVLRAAGAIFFIGFLFLSRRASLEPLCRSGSYTWRKRGRTCCRPAVSCRAFSCLVLIKSNDICRQELFHGRHHDRHRRNLHRAVLCLHRSLRPPLTGEHRCLSNTCWAARCRCSSPSI
jgi:hypothetical protein